MMSDDIAIKISDVHVSFGNHHVLKGASGEIKKGSIVTFLGRNGCGKSTLLRTLSRLMTPAHGKVWLDGEHIQHYASKEVQLFRLRDGTESCFPASGS